MLYTSMIQSDTIYRNVCTADWNKSNSSPLLADVSSISTALPTEGTLSFQCTSHTIWYQTCILVSDVLFTPSICRRIGDKKCVTYDLNCKKEISVQVAKALARFKALENVGRINQPIQYLASVLSVV